MHTLNQRKQDRLRKIAGTVLLVAGGFFVYSVCLLAFTNFPEIGAFKFAIMGGFSIPATIFLCLGAAIGRFRSWKAPVGFAVLSGVAVNLLVIFTFLCLQLTPEYREYFPNSSLALFNDYLAGVITMAGLAGLGAILISHRHSRTEGGRSA